MNQGDDLGHKRKLRDLDDEDIGDNEAPVFEEITVESTGKYLYISANQIFSFWTWADNLSFLTVTNCPLLYTRTI